MTLDELKKLAEAGQISDNDDWFHRQLTPAMTLKLLEMIAVLRKGCEHPLTQSESALTYANSLERSLGE